MHKSKVLPLVSVIIPTKNSAEFIDLCLQSIKKQTYKNIELIVVDNNSTDKTKEIALLYTKFIFNKGPERSAQRNFGANKSKGKFLLFIDSDMILTSKVVEDCVSVFYKFNDCGGIIIPEESFGVGFWAQVKTFERSFYLGNDSIEAARFFPKKIFNETGGFDETITGPEDWDLSQRVEDRYKIARIKSFIRHYEGKLSFHNTLKKKYYYSKKYHLFENKDKNRRNKKSVVLNRYKVFFSNPSKLLRHPFLSIAMLFLKTCEFGAGGIGFTKSILDDKVNNLT